MAGMEVLSAGMGVAGTMTRGVSHAWTHGCIKADDVGMLGRMSSVGWVTDIGGGLSGCGNAWRWGKPDMSSMRCNSLAWPFC